MQRAPKVLMAAKRTETMKAMRVFTGCRVTGPSLRSSAVNNRKRRRAAGGLSRKNPATVWRTQEWERLRWTSRAPHFGQVHPRLAGAVRR